MQTYLLEFFQNNASPFLDRLAEAVTMLGEEGVYILVTAVFIWAVSKKKGYIMASSLMVSLFANTFLKVVFHRPRPFEVLPDLQGKRLHTATGYSFPSGHTQGASGFYTSLMYLFKNRLLRFSCGLAIFLVGVSRLYLGVHWPVDVLAGWILGIGIAWFMAFSLDRLWDDPSGLKRFLIRVLILTGAVTLVMAVLEIVLFKGSMKVDDFFKSAGIVSGSFGGFLLEKRRLDFDPARGGWLRKVLRVLLGLAGVLLFQSGLKRILPDYFLSHLFRYFIMGFWVTWLFPLLGTRLQLFISPEDQ